VTPAAAELERYLDVGLGVVAEGAALLATARPAEIRTKTDPRDLVTEWDTRCEDLIRERLGALTPEVPVAGEERGGPAALGDDQPCWMLDPIDGTVNFAHGLPIWSIALALMIGGRADVGVIAAPALGWTFWGRRGGGGKFRQGGEEGALRVSAVDALPRALLVTGFPYDRATDPRNNFAQWEHFQRVAGAVRRLGAASLDLCFVARGWLDGYWERRLHPWDIAAGALLVEEAGGVVTDTQGGGFDARRGEVVASNGAIHEDMLSELARADAGRPV
jgi:myo-inositol-1(or 4)-monophosphatase